jgi:ferrous iron transport protein B
MIDLSKKKRITIDIKKLQLILDVPVIPTVVSRGYGLTHIIDKVIELNSEKKEYRIQRYGKEIEDSIRQLSVLLQNIDFPFPVRWIAIKLFASILALVQIALPYILPFYIILYFLEGWGYIARISFLMDNLMHKMGIHGKGCISFIIGFGCNVPGCMSCRIMESKRERFITAILVTLVPCSAVSVIIFGLVGKYVGLQWALGLYLLALAVIFLTGKIASRLLIGEPVELIMPMPDYKTPGLKTILYQTWNALKEFIFIAAPIVIVSGVIIQAINLAGWMPAISSLLSPVTITWLGIPAITGILLIFGILRKELILVMLAAYLGTTSFSEVLTPQQMITLAVVSMFYVPCVATISVLWKEIRLEKSNDDMHA